MLALGIIIGLHVDTRRKKKQIAEIEDEKDSLKETNNEMLDNFAEAYSVMTGTEGQFTEFDFILLSMWMD